MKNRFQLAPIYSGKELISKHPSRPNEWDKQCWEWKRLVFPFFFSIIESATKSKKNITENDTENHLNSHYRLKKETCSCKDWTWKSSQLTPMCGLDRKLSLLVKKWRHPERLTWRAIEAVAIVPLPALAGKRSLSVVAHSVLMAPAWLALVYVCRRERREKLRTEKSQTSSVTISHVLLWPGILTMIFVSLCPKLSSEWGIPSKGVRKNRNHEWALHMTS